MRILDSDLACSIQLILIKVRNHVEWKEVFLKKCLLKIYSKPMF